MNEFDVKITSNTHAVDQDGNLYEIATVTGFDAQGAEHVYTDRKWTFPENYPATATLREDGCVDIN